MKKRRIFRLVLIAPAAALIHLMTEEKEALVFFCDKPNDSPAADGSK